MVATITAAQREREIKISGEESDVTLYGIGIYDHYFPHGGTLGPWGAWTCGKSHEDEAIPSTIPTACGSGSIHRIQLAQSYVIGYRPGNRHER